MQYSDAEILEAANGRSRVLYRRIYDCYYASLSHYASRLCRNIVSEEDVVQEVLLRFWESDGSFNSVQALSAYLYRSVYNACVNALRDGRRHDSLEADGQDPREPDEFNAFRNECLLLEEEYYRQIYQAIDALGGRRRQILLKTLEGKSREEIAAELSISLNTVKTLKRKAFEELRNTLPQPLFLFFLLFMD